MQRIATPRLVTVVACAATALLVAMLPTRVSTPALVAAPADDQPTNTGTPVTASPTGTPNSSRDRTPPSPVSELKMAGNDSSTFTITWHPATDNIAVTQYLVMLNGAYSTRTTSLGANFAWFDDQKKILVQVAALDAAGNRSQWRSLYIVPPPTANSRSTQTQRQQPAPPLDYQTEPATRATSRYTSPPRTTRASTHKPPAADPTETASVPPSATATPKSPAPTKSTPPSKSPSPTKPTSPSTTTSTTTAAPSPSPTGSPNTPPDRGPQHVPSPTPSA